MSENLRHIFPIEGDGWLSEADTHPVLSVEEQAEQPAVHVSQDPATLLNPYLDN